MSTPTPPPPGPQPPQPPQPPYGYGYGYGYPPPPYGGYPAPQPYWTPPRIDPGQLKPSRLWYWLSPIPLVIGAGIAIVLLVGVIQQFNTDLHRFRTPGSVVVKLDKNDERGIYLQTRGAPGARSASSALVSCSVRSSLTGPVTLKDASGFTLTLNSDEYEEQYRFVAPTEGEFTVTCRNPAGIPMAVGPHVAVRRFLGPVVGMIAAFLLGLIATVVIAVVTGVRRSNHKQRLQREALQAHQGSAPGHA